MQNNRLTLQTDRQKRNKPSTWTHQGLGTAEVVAGTPALFDLLERVCGKVCLQPNDIYLCPTLKQTTKMGELKNVLSEVHLKDECVGEMRSWTLSQVPPQFTFQSKSGYFYSIQPHHKCTFLSSQQWSTLDTVLFIKRSFQRRSTPVPCWPGAHMKKLSYEGDSLNSTQRSCNISVTCLIVQLVLLLVSYQQQYHIWTKEVLVFAYPRSTIRLFYWTHS